jgi:hypothetical protein
MQWSIWSMQKLNDQRSVALRDQQATNSGAMSVSGVSCA